jgi:hypothetical protein
MGDRQEAHDLVHDAWVRAAESQPTLSQELHTPSSRAYLYAVAENLVIDHYRRRKRQQDALQGVALWQPAQTDDVKDTHSLRQAIAAVDHALADLPSLPCHLSGRPARWHPQTDIAAQHGTSVKTVEREVQRHGRHRAGIAPLARRPRSAARKGRRRTLGALLSLAGIGVGGSSAWLAWRQWVPSWQLTLSAAQHQPLLQALPDGSSLALDAQSLADVAFYAHQRHVQLHRGTAFSTYSAMHSGPSLWMRAVPASPCWAPASRWPWKMRTPCASPWSKAMCKWHSGTARQNAWP